MGKRNGRERKPEEVEVEPPSSVGKEIQIVPRKQHPNKVVR
jgi:hypothetical protein